MKIGEYKYTRDHLELYHRTDGRLLVSLTPHGASLLGGVEAAEWEDGDGDIILEGRKNVVTVPNPVDGVGEWLFRRELGDDNGRTKPLIIYEPGWTLDDGAELMDGSQYLDFCERETSGRADR